MRYFNDPRQNRLFDVFENILSPLAHKQLLGGWEHVFRETLLRLMPVDTVKEHFDPVTVHGHGAKTDGGRGVHDVPGLRGAIG